jgi:hypothetical protein
MVCWTAYLAQGAPYRIYLILLRPHRPEFHKSQIEYEGELRRFSLRALAPSVSAAAAEELCVLLRSCLNPDTPFNPSTAIPTTVLSHVIPDEYLRLREDPSNLARILMTFSLSNYTSPFKYEIILLLLVLPCSQTKFEICRDDIIADPLCQSITDSALCISFLMACGNADEQYAKPESPPVPTPAHPHMLPC